MRDFWWPHFPTPGVDKLGADCGLYESTSSISVGTRLDAATQRCLSLKKAGTLTTSQAGSRDAKQHTTLAKC